METTTAQAVGLHYGLDADAYHAVDAVSNTRLGWFLQSPAHYRAFCDTPLPPTDAMAFGTAAHYAMLEPDAFAERYTVAGQCEATTGKGKRCTNTGATHRGGEWYCGVRGHDPEPDSPAEPVLALSLDDYARCVAIRDAVYSHPEARAALTGAPKEVSVFWTDPDTGLPCKLRADAINDAHGCSVDVKTAADARPHQFGGSAYRLGYHRQAVWYLDGIARFPEDVMPLDRHLIVAAEKERPFGVNVYRVPDFMLDAGRVEIMTLMERLAECHAKDDWPMESHYYSRAIRELVAPPYALADIDERVQEMAVA